jgi:DNA-binding transcriptional ArsR family regulator
MLRDVRPDRGDRDWSLLSHHGLVLCEVAATGDVTIRDLSDTLGITERHVSRILRDLQDARMLNVRRSGRRNHYSLARNARFRHPRLAHIPLREVMGLLSSRLVQARETRRIA